MNARPAPVLALALALAACNGDVPEEGTGASGAAEIPAQPRKEARTMNQVDERLEPLAAEAASDLARRLEIDKSEVEVAEALFVTWPNSALGCPEPDMMYTQALVPGYRIRLVASGNSYHYHGARDKPPFYCPTERVRAPAAGNGNLRETR